MKKILLCLVSIFICSNVYALTDIELYINNPEGVKTESNIIPYQTKVKLVEASEDKDYVTILYNEKDITVNKTDVKVVKEEFTSTDGTSLNKEVTIKTYGPINMYKGPSILFTKVDTTIPENTELAYKYSYNDKYAYVTYNGVNGWISIDTSKETLATKEQGSIIVINPDSINARKTINGEYTKINIPTNTVLTYAYSTKYQYNVIYSSESLWISQNGVDAFVVSTDIESININAGDIIYEAPDTTKSLYTFNTAAKVKPLFTYKDYYYVEYDNAKGWVKPNNSVAIVDEPIKTDASEIKETTPNKKNVKVELIVVISLGVLLVLSLTSLIAIVLMNKKNGGKIYSEPSENPTNTDKIE